MTRAYLFPGQGSQAVGMGLKSYQRHAAARALFEQADQQLGYPLTTLCFEGPLEQLTATEMQQPALFTVAMAHWAIINSAENTPPPTYLAGQSLGEISALTAAGYFSFEDGLHLAHQRGKLMQAGGLAKPGAMTAVLGLEIEKVAACCAAVREESKLIVAVANDNSAVQQIVAGEPAALDLVEAKLRDAGAKKLLRLPISIGSHCALMVDVAQQFAALLDEIEILQGTIPVVGNVSAEILPNSPAAIRHELTTQLTSPVRWRESMLTLTTAGADTFIEVGPGDVLTKLMKRIDRSVTRYTFQP